MSSLPFQPAAIAPSEVGALIVPDDPDVTFGGFDREAFALLERLRAHPHIEQYRNDKAGIREHIKEPFKAYRDDVVVNLVLPNRIDLETERNVFSRLLKNDFGAGGCHHHFWFSFYRPNRTRLTDIQLVHSLRPSGLRIAVFAGKQADDAFQQALRIVWNDPDRCMELIHTLQDTGGYTFTSYRRECTRHTERLERLPADMQLVDGFALHRTLEAEEVVRLGGRIIPEVLACIAQLWPVYRFLLS